MDFFEQNNFDDGKNAENSGGKNITRELNAPYSADEYARYVARRKFNRTPLILALLGLIFSVFYGAGMVLGIIALVTAAKRYKIHKSEPLKWAIIVSITCIAVSVAFISALFGATVAAIIKQLPDEPIIAFVGC